MGMDYVIYVYCTLTRVSHFLKIFNFTSLIRDPIKFYIKGGIQVFELRLLFYNKRTKFGNLTMH